MLLTSNTHETPKKNSYIVRCIWLFLCGIQWYSPLFRLPQFQPSQKALNKNPQFLHSQHFLVSLWFLQRSECKNRIKKKPHKISSFCEIWSCKKSYTAPTANGTCWLVDNIFTIKLPYKCGKKWYKVNCSNIFIILMMSGLFFCLSILVYKCIMDKKCIR